MCVCASRSAAECKERNRMLRGRRRGEKLKPYTVYRRVRISPATLMDFPISQSRQRTAAGDECFDIIARYTLRTHASDGGGRGNRFRSL